MHRLGSTYSVTKRWNLSRRALHFSSARWSNPKYHDSFVITVNADGECGGEKAESAGVLAESDVKKLWSSALHQDPIEANAVRIFHIEGKATALVSLGKDYESKRLNAKRETYKRATASGVRQLTEQGAKSIVIDIGDQAHAAAVAAHLASFKFNLKTDKKLDDVVISHREGIKDHDVREWKKGCEYARSQNLARELKELPANLLTPTTFSERIQAEFKDVDGVDVSIHGQDWAESLGMSAYLSVGKGSAEPLKFLEIRYNGLPSSRTTHLSLVGKGITFDSGGISIKPSADMKKMRGDMGGAAVVAAASLAIARLKFPINLTTCIPLCENMPGPSASRPGDIIYAMNGKSIEIDNTDAEGRLILADALHYTSSKYKPGCIIDVATLTGAMDVALGQVFTGVFSNSDSLWNELHAAGEEEFDRFWRMPLDEEYMVQISKSNADLCNVGGRSAGSCTAALFLKNFVAHADETRWAHLDIAGTMESSWDMPYQRRGMTGRGTRGLIEFARRLAENA